jgi:hypothetical protein
MLGLPKTTDFNRRIPKQKFYDNLSVTPAIKRIFIDQIKIIYWRNKIAASTMNLAGGQAVTEIEVFEIQLNQPSLNEAVLKLIDKEIPYHILFLLTYEDKVQAWIGYKEATASSTGAFKVNRYYHTEWMPLDKLQLPLAGLNLDAVYENYVRQIAGDALNADSGESLKEAVEQEKKKQELEKKIAALEAKIRKEKQFNRQLEMNAVLKKIKKELYNS